MGKCGEENGGVEGNTAPRAAKDAATSFLSFCACSAKGKVLRLILLFSLSSALWPVDVLYIREDAPGVSGASGDAFAGATVFGASAPLGLEFQTSYLHSVQLTPIIDVYRVVGGRIWQWREFIRSHNAGLPFAAPEFGRFYACPPWMVLEGGRQARRETAARVGDADSGRNMFACGGFRTALYERYPGKRLYFGVERIPLAWACRSPVPIGKAAP